MIFLIFPYLIKNFSSLFSSIYFDSFKLFLVIVLLLAFQIGLSLIFRIKKGIIAVSLIYVSLFIFLYGFDIINSFQKFEIFLYGKIYFRARVIIFIFWCFLLFIFYLLSLKKNSFEQVNLFFILLSLISLFDISISDQVRGIKKLKSSFNKIGAHPKPNENLFLIILDEYAAPSEIEKALNDTSVYNFNFELEKRGWVVKEGFRSQETSTILSLGSLFNFNLSQNENFRNLTNEETLIDGLFVKAKLADSLKVKGVKIINKGIFPLGYTRPLSLVYIYPTSFLERLLQTSLSPILESYIISKSKGKAPLNSHSPAFHNKKIFSSLSEFKSAGKTFVYVHLYMPHPPFEFYTEFPARSRNTQAYFEYWKFTNKKLLSILDSLTISKGSRVIVTGDHGYRFDSSMNAQNTFSAFYGFDESILNKIESVQDLGGLINCSFSKK